MPIVLKDADHEAGSRHTPKGLVVALMADTADPLPAHNHYANNAVCRVLSLAGGPFKRPLT
jgi:hypothetical protein